MSLFSKIKALISKTKELGSKLGLLSSINIGFILFFSILFFQWQSDIDNNLTQTIAITKDHLQAKKNVTLSFDRGVDKPLLEFSQYPESPFTRTELLINLPSPIKAGVLEIVVNSEERFPAINKIDMRAVSVKGLNQSSAKDFLTSKWLRLGNQNNTYHFPFSSNSKDNKILLQLKGHIYKLNIDSITLRPTSFADSQFATVWLCLLIFFNLFLPGLVIYAVKGSIANLPGPFISFLYSIPVHLITLLLCLSIQANSFYWPVLILITLLIAGFIRFKLIKDDVNNNKKLTFINTCNQLFCIASIIIIALIYVNPASLQNSFYHQISSTHTFNAFSAHDSVFQYNNAHSVLENNFEKYYDLKSTISYKPQDREIFPGLHYASMVLGLEGIVGKELAKKFLPYAFFYLLCHWMLFFMIQAWLRPLNDKTSYWIALFIMTTPAMWILGILGWFKLTGAAMILAAMLVIKNKPEKITYWVFAGVLLGLAKNYHGANALCFPILVLWMLWRTEVIKPKINFKNIIGKFSALTITACTLIFIWPMYVKYAWDTGTHKLFSQHYLHGNFIHNSLYDSITRFFNRIPWSEQVDTRLERTKNLFSKDDGIIQYLELNALQYEGLMQLWLKVSGSYIFPALLLFLAASLIIKSISFISETPTAICTDKKDKWLSQFGFISLLTIITIGYLSYGGKNSSAGIIWHLPPIAVTGLLLWTVLFSLRSKLTTHFWKYVAIVQTTIIALSW